MRQRELQRRGLKRHLRRRAGGPAERALAQRLGVSRPFLRNAQIALEIAGAIEIRMGSGLYVLARNARPPRPVATGGSPAALMQARAAIEGAVIVLAAVRMT